MKTFQYCFATMFLVTTTETIACSDSEREYEAACDAQCECAGCGDEGLQACYDTGRTNYEFAVEKGCQAESEAATACTAEFTDCEEPGFMADDACDAERVALSECLHG